jgi:hypothetical protein
MLTIPLNDVRLKNNRRDDRRAVVSRHDAEQVCAADAPDLVEWELSATQVGSLIAAIALCCGLVSLFA